MVSEKRLMHQVESRNESIELTPGIPYDWMDLKPGEEKQIPFTYVRNGQTTQMKITGKRLKNETITVTAGEYKDCRKVKQVLEFTASLPNGERASIKMESIYWYHPKINGFVKETFQATRAGSGTEPRQGTSELKSYTIEKKES